MSYDLEIFIIINFQILYKLIFMVSLLDFYSRFIPYSWVEVRFTGQDKLLSPCIFLEFFEFVFLYSAKLHGTKWQIKFERVLNPSSVLMQNSNNKNDKTSKTFNLWNCDRIFRDVWTLFWNQKNNLKYLTCLMIYLVNGTFYRFRLKK